MEMSVCNESAEPPAAHTSPAVPLDNPVDGEDISMSVADEVFEDASEEVKEQPQSSQLSNQEHIQPPPQSLNSPKSSGPGKLICFCNNVYYTRNQRLVVRGQPRPGQVF